MLGLLLVLSAVEDWLTDSPVTAGPRDPQPRVIRLSALARTRWARTAPVEVQEPAADREAVA